VAGLLTATSVVCDYTAEPIWTTSAAAATMGLLAAGSDAAATADWDRRVLVVRCTCDWPEFDGTACSTATTLIR